MQFRQNSQKISTLPLILILVLGCVRTILAGTQEGVVAPGHKSQITVATDVKDWCPEANESIRDPRYVF